MTYHGDSNTTREAALLRKEFQRRNNELERCKATGTTPWWETQDPNIERRVFNAKLKWADAILEEKHMCAPIYRAQFCFLINQL